MVIVKSKRFACLVNKTVSKIHIKVTANSLPDFNLSTRFQDITLFAWNNRDIMNIKFLFWVTWNASEYLKLIMYCDFIYVYMTCIGILK